MATSRSSRKTFKWVGGALVFSGRPDPTWELSQKTAKQLMQIWRSLEGHTEEPATSPGLGYRGSFLKGPEGHEWLAWGGVVTLRTAAGRESRIDKNRSFEKSLLSSAPKGMVPAALFD